MIRDFGLGFVQNDPRYAKLLEDASGADHHILPVPAIVVVDAERRVRFLHADPAYAQRLPIDVVRAVAAAWGPDDD